MFEDHRENNTIACVAVSRGGSLVRGVLWVAASTLCGVITVVVLGSLDFSPAGISHRLVDVALLIAVSPVAILGVYLGLCGLRWLGLAGWPGFVGVVATRDALVLRFGPFGTRRFDTGRLELKYAFELSADEEDGGFESFLPKEEQIARFLPRMFHPDGRGRIDVTILKYTGHDESVVARAFRPAFDLWRSGINGEA